MNLRWLEPAWAGVIGIGMKYLTLLCLLAMSLPAVTSADEATLITAGKIYTMNGKTLSPGQILIVDGKIKAVGKSVSVAGLSPTKMELGKDAVIMPGLVDPYSQSALPSSGVNEASNEVTPDFKTSLAVDWDSSDLHRQNQLGTTTMCVCPGTQNVFSGIAAIIKTSDELAIMINDDGPLLASLCSDPARGNRARSRPDSVFVRQPTNRMGVVWILRSTFDKAMRGVGGADKANAMKVVKQSVKGKRPMMFVSRMSYDLTSVASLADEFGFNPILVGGQEAYKVKEMIAERKYSVILQILRLDTTRGAEGAELIWNQPGVLAEAGITFALSGDDLLEQARFAHRNGLDHDMALAAITTTPASILGLEKQVGAIKVGFDADLVVLDGEPLELTTSIRQVIINGETSNHDKETK